MVTRGEDIDHVDIGYTISKPAPLHVFSLREAVASLRKASDSLVDDALTSLPDIDSSDDELDEDFFNALPKSV